MTTTKTETEWDRKRRERREAATEAWHALLWNTAALLSEDEALYLHPGRYGADCSRVTLANRGHRLRSYKERNYSTGEETIEHAYKALPGPEARFERRSGSLRGTLDDIYTVVFEGLAPGTRYMRIRGWKEVGKLTPAVFLGRLRGLREEMLDAARQERERQDRIDAAAAEEAARLQAAREAEELERAAAAAELGEPLESDDEGDTYRVFRRRDGLWGFADLGAVFTTEEIRAIINLVKQRAAARAHEQRQEASA